MDFLLLLNNVKNRSTPILGSKKSENRSDSWKKGVVAGMQQHNLFLALSKKAFTNIRTKTIYLCK